MGRIRGLAPDVIEKIAAGEVVERPASVVKELVENAIDAGAKTVSIDCAGGGAERITVIDDGIGMGSDDLAESVRRHATSKISDADDLWNITTMGFRGEALAAISAVSKLVVESKPNAPDVIEGASLTVEGGIASGPIVAGCAGGTRIVVSDLFYNVPARRKFLRSSKVESGHIYDVVAQYALAYPRLRFELAIDGSRRLNLPACTADIGDVGSTERIRAVMGDRTGALLAVGESSPEISVRGAVAMGGRRGGKDVYLFLNGRPVKDRMLMHAITQAFGERCHGGEYPAAVLWIDIDTAKVDVNVHPAKREVRFSDTGAVYSFLLSAVRKPVSEAWVSISAEPACTSGVEEAINRFESSRLASEETPMWDRDRGVRGRAHHAPCQTEAVGARLAPLGQYALGYVVCEDADGSLVLIDQHAAHERLGFEELKAAYADGSIPQQRLLIPESVDLGESAAAYIEENMEGLAAAGFELEPFGGGTIVVKAIPAMIGGKSVAALMERLAQEFEGMGRAPSVDEAMERIFALTACHGQVRAGDRLTGEELAALVRDVERNNVTSCPHGRPAVVRIERVEIEKWFKRR